MSEQPFNSHFHKRGQDQDPRWLPFLALMLGTAVVCLVAVPVGAIISLGRAAITWRGRP